MQNLKNICNNLRSIIFHFCSIFKIVVFKSIFKIVYFLNHEFRDLHVKDDNQGPRYQSISCNIIPTDVDSRKIWIYASDPESQDGFV